MAINFPNSPSDGQQLTEGSVTYTYNATKGYWESTESSSNSSSSTTVVANMSALIALTGMSNGDQALVQATNKLYMYSGTGWYIIATIQNDAPSAITGVSGTYELAIDGTATTITASSTDPEGFPLTWSYSTSGLGSIATVSQTENVFTITPSTTEADAGTFTLTINATDGINGAVSTSTNFTLDFVFTVTNSRYTTLLATATDTSDNNNITDSSTNNHSITVSGDAHAGTFSPYRSGGYSTYFDGNDYLTATHTNPLGTADFTVEGWINFDNVGGNRTFITLDDSAQLYFRNNGSSIAIYGISGGTYNFSTGTPDINTWYHFAFVRQSGSITLYWDGQSKGSVGCTDNFNSGNLHIGCWSAISEFFQGHLTDVKISNTAVYTSNFSIPTERLSPDSSTKLITCHLPYIADGSNLAETIVVNGDPETKPFSPYDYTKYSATDHGGSAYFDGSGDYLGVANSTDFDLGSTWTIKGWVYPDEISTSNQYGIITNMNLDGGGALERGFTVLLNYNSGWRLRVGIYNSSGGWAQLYGTAGTITPDAWNYIEVNYASGTMTIKVNGSQDTSGSVHQTGATTQSLIVGADRNANTLSSNIVNHFKGYISDLQLVNGSTSEETTAPTAPMSPVSNTKLHIKGTDASIIDKAQGSNLKLVGNTTGSTTQVKFSNTKSMYFDGSADYIRLEDLGTGALNTTSGFTIESWMYPIEWSTAQGNHALFGLNLISNGENVLVFAAYGGGALYSGSGNVQTSSDVSINQWSHVACVVVGTSTKIYLNGSEVLSHTFANLSGVNWEDCILAIGAEYDAANGTGVGNWFKGYIQDFRITKGLARYTANFTPPSASLEG
jgi:hypothetical protein